jgi:hypothetical protein
LYEASTDNSAHLGKLFIFVGNTDLSNKMVPYTASQKVFVVKTFYCFGCSCVAADGQCRTEIFVPVAPSTGTVYLIIERFEETGSVSLQ